LLRLSDDYGVVEHWFRAGPRRSRQPNSLLKKPTNDSLGLISIHSETHGKKDSKIPPPTGRR